MFVDIAFQQGKQHQGSNFHAPLSLGAIQTIHQAHPLMVKSFQYNIKNGNIHTIIEFILDFLYDNPNGLIGKLVLVPNGTSKMLIIYFVDEEKGQWDKPRADEE